MHLQAPGATASSATSSTFATTWGAINLEATTDQKESMFARLITSLLHDGIQHRSRSLIIKLQRLAKKILITHATTNPLSSIGKVSGKKSNKFVKISCNSCPRELVSIQASAQKSKDRQGRNRLALNSTQAGFFVVMSSEPEDQFQARRNACPIQFRSLQSPSANAMQVQVQVRKNFPFQTSSGSVREERQ